MNGLQTMSEPRTALDLVCEMWRGMHSEAPDVVPDFTLTDEAPIIARLAAIPADAVEQIARLRKEVNRLEDQLTYARRRSPLSMER